MGVAHPRISTAAGGGAIRGVFARDAALGEAADAQGRCKSLESELQGLWDQLAKEVCIRQEKEEDMKTREGPSLAGRTMESFLRGSLIRQAREEAER